jgi:hypothetical protein
VVVAIIPLALLQWGTVPPCHHPCRPRQQGQEQGQVLGRLLRLVLGPRPCFHRPALVSGAPDATPKCSGAFATDRVHDQHHAKQHNHEHHRNQHMLHPHPVKDIWKSTRTEMIKRMVMLPWVRMKRAYDELFEHDLIAQAVERGVEESGRVKGYR